MGEIVSLANRAERRRTERVRARYHVWPPRNLSMVRGSANYDPDACSLILSVTVEGVEVPRCAEYDMDRGFARTLGGKRVYGNVGVTLK